MVTRSQTTTHRSVQLVMLEIAITMSQLSWQQPKWYQDCIYAGGWNAKARLDNVEILRKETRRSEVKANSKETLAKVEQLHVTQKRHLIPSFTISRQ